MSMSMPRFFFPGLCVVYKGVIVGAVPSVWWERIMHQITIPFLFPFFSFPDFRGVYRGVHREGCQNPLGCCMEASPLTLAVELGIVAIRTTPLPHPAAGALCSSELCSGALYLQRALTHFLVRTKKSLSLFLSFFLFFLRRL